MGCVQSSGAAGPASLKQDAAAVADATDARAGQQQQQSSASSIQVATAAPTTLMFHIGTNNWQRQGEFAPGSGILHASMHSTFNAMPGVRCYSMYPSKRQTDPTEADATFRIFKLTHDIPICESVSPNSSYRWHSMSEEEFTNYCQRLEDEVCAYMDEIERKEGREIDYLVTHHAFTNAMVGARIAERRSKEGRLKKLSHFNFVHGTALKMYIKEKEGDAEYPMRFLKLAKECSVFNGSAKTSGIWVNSEDYIGKFLECFPSYPKKQLVFSRIGVNQNIFCPKGTTVKDMAAHVRAEDREKLDSIKRLVTFVGKFADWKRLDAVLRAAAVYESSMPDVGTLVIGSGPPEAVAQYEGLAKDLNLQRTLFIGAQGQEVLAAAFSASELGLFPSYREPFGMVFIECMACGTPAIGARSGGPVEFLTPDFGMLVDEEDDWRSQEGSARLGARLAEAVTQALREDWKAGPRGMACLEAVRTKFSTHSQCQSMLEDMRVWSQAQEAEASETLSTAPTTASEAAKEAVMTVIEKEDDVGPCCKAYSFCSI